MNGHSAVPAKAADTLKLEVEEPSIPRKNVWKQRWEATQAFIIQHWLPIIFAVAIVIALSWPAPGRFLARIRVAGDIPIVQESIMGVVFFISGLTLDTQDLKRAQGHKLGVLYGLLAILFITPCWGFVIRTIPLDPKLLTVGLVIYCVVPTTLGIGIALVRSCKGNDGIAKLLTVATNIIGVVTMPLMLKFLFLNYDLSGLSVRVDLLNLFARLALTILVPSVLGKALREFVPPASRFAARFKTFLSMLNTFGLAAVMWQVLSSARDRLFDLSARAILGMIFITISIYLFYLVVNWLVIHFGFRGMPLPEAVAVIIMASQKSAPVAVTLISYTTSDPVEQGLLAIPAIVGQLTQIFTGSAMAPPIAKKVNSWKAEQAALKQAAEAQQPAAAPAQNNV